MPQFETEKPNLPVPTQAQKEMAELRRRKELQRQAESEQNALAIIPNHIVILIDDSGSMTNYFQSNGSETLDRRAAAKQAMRRLVSSSNPKTTAYSLVVFDSLPHLIVPKTTSYINIQAATYDFGNSTNMNDGIIMSISQQPTRIILLSDGQPDYKPETAVRLAVEKKIIIDTISIGSANDTLMKWISEMTGGVWKRCDDLESLSDHFLLLEPSNYLQLEHK